MWNIQNNIVEPYWVFRPSMAPPKLSRRQMAKLFAKSIIADLPLDILAALVVWPRIVVDAIGLRAAQEADATAHILVRLWKYMKSRGITTAIPRVPQQGAGPYRKFWHLSSTYSEHAESSLPKYGTKGPWKPKNSPPVDWFQSKWGDIVTGLQFSA
ncbi:hypothetical protein O1611_g1302 [Lasiodiplodia mahajangana]|uniref:Uncharacterized protein n=1 Tax=Lasiodiplodia mahajangana TaxID=1108764 RepID=A0ACC2JY19_9PEZI|nr:hypothetical protein O1611_g1302 [Lasiodiplodia mahajangana]